MPVIKCEVCGSGSLTKTDGIFVCDYCGTKYSLEEAQKLLGTVKIDRSEIKDNLLALARRAYNIQDYAGAATSYGNLLVEDAFNWEAFFYSSICQASIEPNLRNDSFIVTQLQKTIAETIKLINSRLEAEEQKEALQSMCYALDRYIRERTNAIMNYSFTDTILTNNNITAFVSLYDYLDTCLNNCPNMNRVIVQEQYYFRDYLRTCRAYINRKYMKELESRIGL